MTLTVNISGTGPEDAEAKAAFVAAIETAMVEVRKSPGVSLSCTVYDSHADPQSRQI